ncbi:hypothetical protein [Escherichia coli]|uniref:hypothetical protein n=1 Tax=Escherichia coli TaxID=562 RepID=UPI000CFAF2AC|nr:hypothetical protein [Escherichia coli]
MSKSKTEQVLTVSTGVQPDAKIDNEWSYTFEGDIVVEDYPSVGDVLDILGYDKSTSMIKDPLEYVKQIKKLADLSSKILKTIDDNL